MKIYIITRGYPSAMHPTWGCFEKDQAEALAKLGHQVVYLSVDTRFRRKRGHLGIHHNKINNVNVYNFVFIPLALLFFLPQSLKNYVYSFLYSRVFKQALRKEGNPDVMYAHYLGYINIALNFKKTTGIPVVGIEHWSELGKEEVKSNILTLAQQVYPHINQLITVSNYLKSNIQRHLNIKNIEVVHNLVGKEFFYIPQNIHHTFTIISTGSLIHRKGFDLLISALSKIDKHLPDDWRTIIIGSGELKDALQEQINDFNLQNHIYLVGQKNKDEIVHLLQRSDIFILPSRSETFGVAYIEAMACGLPIIATDCGGPKDIVKIENGLLIPNEDVDALGNAILYMVKNINRYDRKSIAEDCQIRFAPEVIAKRLTTIFEETIKTHKEQQ